MKNEIFENKRIIIYGSGDRCEDFITSHGNINILGIIDRFKVSGSIKGVPIITWERVDGLNADYMVIAAADCWYKEIYERIFSICLNKGLRIYSQFGQDLVEYFGNIYTKSVPKIPMSTIFDLIDRHDIISFDIFDTLLIRTVPNPRDVFSLMEHSLKKEGINVDNFHDIRIECELKTKGKRFDEIYDTIKEKLNCSDHTIFKLKKIEIETERKILSSRKELLEVYNYAKHKNKEIILVSDMYLPISVVEDLLIQNNIGGYSRIFLSCEEGVEKGDNLFDIVYENYCGKRIVHFGDNIYLDGECPARRGFSTYVIPSTKDYFTSTRASNALNYVKTNGDKRLIGKIIASCFSNRNDLCFLFARDLAQIFCTPFVILYLDRIFKNLTKKEYDGVLFPARDGYILKDIYDEVAPKLGITTKSFYIASSRKLMVKTGISNKQELLYSYKYAKLVKEPLKYLYGLSQAEIVGADTYENIESHKDRIFNKSINTKHKYLNYLNALGVDENKNYLLCEMNGQGTTQYYLSKFFGMVLNTVYLIRWHTDDLLESDAVFDFWKGDGQYSCLNHRFDVLEGFFTAPHPSIVDISDNLKPIYSKENRNEKQIKTMLMMQEYVHKQTSNFFDEYYSVDEELSPEIAEQLLKVFEDCEFKGEASNILFNKYFDDLSGEYVRIQ